MSDKEMYELKFYGDAAHTWLWYPRNSDIKYLVLGLMDIRAADDIRVSYDFDRDGWVIEQASVFEWDGDDPICDSDWQEVAFIQAWARQKIPPPEDDR